MHRQMSISRKAPAVEHDATAVATGPTAADQAPAVLPGKAKRVSSPEIEHTGDYEQTPVEKIAYILLQQ